MSLHIKAVSKALSYPLYPPNLARRRFRIPDILFTVGTVTSHAPQAPELEQALVSGVFSPWLASSAVVTSQARVKSENRTTKKEHYGTDFRFQRRRKETFSSVCF